MSSIANWFGWSSSIEAVLLPEVFPLGITQNLFVKIDVENIFKKILTDVLERTYGLDDDQMELMWDNCVKSNASEGLVSLIACAMTSKQNLYVVYDQALELIRRATPEETTKIRADYDKQGESKLGVFISFQHFLKSDLIRLYSALQYVTVSSLHKAMNLSKAVQFKMNDLRGSVSLTDSADVKAQAKDLANSLATGKDVLLDGKDTIETATPDLTAIEKAHEMITQKLSFYLGLPAAYISGEQTGGLSTTGEGDTKAVERGLKNYYLSIMKPALEAIFDVETSYKSQDFRQIEASAEIMKTFFLTDDELISKENKTKILNSLFGLPEDAEGDAPVKPDPAQVVAPPVATGTTGDKGPKY